MTNLTGRKPILCLDFDGVCHSYTSGWKGADVIPDPPVPDMWEFLFAAAIDFEINIYSSRSGQAGGIDAMRDWFITWYAKQVNATREADQESVTKAQITPIVTALLRFPTEKPPAFIGIDDRVLTFTGQWPTVEEMKNFQPWNKLGVSGPTTPENKVSG